MADNRSLDEFVADEGPADEAGVTPGDPETPDATAPEAANGVDAAEDAVEPVAETFAWSPTGGDCATCGEAVDERWRDGDALVCAECKAW